MEVKLTNTTNENNEAIVSVDEKSLASLIHEFLDAGAAKSTTDCAKAMDVLNRIYSQKEYERAQFWRNVDAKNAFEKNVEKAMNACTSALPVPPTAPVSTITESEKESTMENIFNPNANNGTRESVNLINLCEMADKAVAEGMSIEAFVKEAVISYVSAGGDITAVAGVRSDAEGSYAAAMARKREADDKDKYQSMSSLDRMLIQLTESMIDFGNSSMAGLVQALLEEKASKVRISYEIGKNAGDKNMMNDLRYIVNALKRETPTSGPWANKLVECYYEIFSKK